MLILERESVPYLPTDQGARGGPVTLGIVKETENTRIITLPGPSGGTVTVPLLQFDIPGGGGSDVALLWKLRAGTPIVDQNVVYSLLTSPWRSAAYVRSQTYTDKSKVYWPPDATGRLSVYSTTPPADLNDVYTWDWRPAAGNSYYNGRDERNREDEGLLGLLYFKNFSGGSIILPAAFGDRLANLEWALAAHVVGAPLYHGGGPCPKSVSEAEEKTTLRTRRGRVFTSPRSAEPIVRFRLSDPNLSRDWGWHTTLKLASALDSFVCFPAGINDIYSEDEAIDFLSLGYARRMAMTRFSGIQPPSNSCTTGEAIAFSATFEEAIR